MGLRRSPWAAVGVAFVVLASACGGSSSGESANTLVADPPTSEGTASSTPTTAATQATAPTTAPSTPTTSPSSTTTTTAAPAGLELPDDCRWREAEFGPTLTFVVDDRLYEYAQGDGIRCLVDAGASTTSLSWSPTGRRALIDGGVIFDRGERRATGATGAATAGWTWPTGLRFVQAQGPTLTKVEADGSGVIDISFLDDHGAATYHPDGLHLAVAGTGTATAEWYDWDNDEFVVEEWTQTGLFLVKNDGTGQQVWIDTRDAEITDIAFSAEGTQLTFVADHGDEQHIHSFDLPAMLWETDDGERLLTALPEDPELLEPEIESQNLLSHLTIDSDDPYRIMYANGDCATGSSVERYRLDQGGYPFPVAAGFNAVPVGFLDQDTVVVLEHHPSCDGTGALWITDLVSGESTLVAPRVDVAAVRWQAPDLVFSMKDIIIAGFA